MHSITMDNISLAWPDPFLRRALLIRDDKRPRKKGKLSIFIMGYNYNLNLTACLFKNLSHIRNQINDVITKSFPIH